MNTLVFVQQFPDETACRENYKDMRLRQGVICKRCNGTSHYWLRSKWQFECKSCHFRTTLRSGTVMENSNLPFRTWYLAILFMTATKKGMSACEMRRQLDHKRYATIWSLMHRIRTLMGRREDLYSLAGMVEFDEGFFKIAFPAKERPNLKHGKGSQRLRNVGVIAESTPLEDPVSGVESRQCRYFKMKFLKTQKAESINTLIQKAVTANSVVFTDQANHYQDIHKFVEMHVIEKSTKETTKKTLTWSHIAISNAKRNFLGVYHKINEDYLQNYLNEFVYKLNRRFSDNMFDNVIRAAVFPYWYNCA